MTIIIYITIFTILFLTINSVLAENTLTFGNKPKVLSFCITVLCMTGMHEAFRNINQKEINFVLLPYAALAVSVFIMILLKGLFCLIRKKDKFTLSDKKEQIMDKRMRK